MYGACMVAHYTNKMPNKTVSTATCLWWSNHLCWELLKTKDILRPHQAIYRCVGYIEGCESAAFTILESPHYPGGWVSTKSTVCECRTDPTWTLWSLQHTAESGPRGREWITRWQSLSPCPDLSSLCQWLCLWWQSGVGKGSSETNKIND